MNSSIATIETLEEPKVMEKRVPSAPTKTQDDQIQNPGLPIRSGIYLHEDPLKICCPYCHEIITTKLTHYIGKITNYFALVVLIGFFPLFWLPYFLNCCKDVEHSCPSCGAILGRYRRSTPPRYATGKTDKSQV